MRPIDYKLFSFKRFFITQFSIFSESITLKIIFAKCNPYNKTFELYNNAYHL